MARKYPVPTSAIPKGKERPVRKDARVNLLPMLDVLLKHLTPALCKAVFKRHRKKERERKWTLYAVTLFWAAMIIRHPPAIDHGLAETRKGRGRDRLWPRVQVSARAFYKKAAGLRADLFLAVYETFVASILPQAPQTYASWMADLRKQFADVLIVDGSRLDALVHQLKMLRPNRRVALAGCVTVYYDLWRGIPRRVFFYADAAKAELTRALETLKWLPKGALLVGDRLYASVKFFAALSALGVYGVFRLNGLLKVRRVEVLARHQDRWGFVEDALVEVGSGQRGVPCQTLDLHTLHASHPNLIGQQVYAAAMVYTASRIAQAGIAEKAGVLPEQISPAKLFPRLAQAANDYCVSQIWVMKARAMNPGVDLKLPGYNVVPSSHTRLRAILVRRRLTERRRFRFCPSRRRWTSIKHVPGGPTLLESVHDG
ncbi:MAG: hypothetical protein HY748_12065 [Elusimicrobia bacterium]|nr:hypothetical protein [Elusimicrobiota bacterium]